MKAAATAIALLLPFAVFAAGSRVAPPYQGAISTEYPSGRVLFADRADAKCLPASCTKLMTARLVLKAVREKRLSFDDRIYQTKLSAGEEPSKLGLAPGEWVTVSNAIAALMVKSANDVAVALAERIGGSVEGFVAQMNAEAADIGMANTRFVSPNGLPPPKGSRRGYDVSTPADLARLAAALVRDEPEILGFTSLVSVDIPGTGGKTLTFRNHNNLLWKKGLAMREVDGLKTGYFKSAGFSIVATGSRRGRRARVVVAGSADPRARDAAARDLLSKALDAIDW